VGAKSADVVPSPGCTKRHSTDRWRHSLSFKPRGGVVRLSLKWRCRDLNWCRVLSAVSVVFTRGVCDELRPRQIRDVCTAGDWCPRMSVWSARTCLWWAPGQGVGRANGWAELNIQHLPKCRWRHRHGHRCQPFVTTRMRCVAYPGRLSGTHRRLVRGRPASEAIA